MTDIKESRRIPGLPGEQTQNKLKIKYINKTVNNGTTWAYTYYYYLIGKNNSETAAHIFLQRNLNVNKHDGNIMLIKMSNRNF